MWTLKPQYLQLLPSATDEKRWVAEITGDDPTFVLKREFHPETESGVWAMYDGWYQIHGQTPGITPFQKEYVRVLDGKMTRRLNFRYVVEHVPQIKAGEPERKERLKHQISSILDEVKDAAPHEMVEEAILKQKEDLDMVETSEELLGGLRVLLKQKERMIKQYKEAIDKMQSQSEW